MKLAANIHHVSGNLRQGFQGQRSKVKGHSEVKCTFRQSDYLSTYGRPSVVRAAEAYGSTVWSRLSCL